MSATPATDLWLERSRLNGMLLGGISYGILFTLTVQCLDLLLSPQAAQIKIANNQSALVTYVVITFALATVGFAGNARYTQEIWIDLRDAPGGPAALITFELDHWINMMALASYYVMGWFMNALLLQRCFIIWDWRWYIIVVMSCLFLGDIAVSILILQRSGMGAVFYNNKIQLAYLSIQVVINIIYTLLVTGRILAVRKQVVTALGLEHAKMYTSVAAMIVESASLYTILGIMFIISFSLGSNVSNLIFLSISHVQGIAQLLIIRRVATGRAFASDGMLTCTLMEFATVTNGTPSKDGTTVSSPLAASEEGKSTGHLAEPIDLSVIKRKPNMKGSEVTFSTETSIRSREALANIA